MIYNLHLPKGIVLNRDMSQHRVFLLAQNKSRHRLIERD